MAFVKIVKNKAYYKRYQTKYRRRREGKTDYYARKRLITINKDKYNTQKYRLVCRITNKQCITQIIWATLKGDEVLCQASSSELTKFGLTCGLKNYSSCYATGLLIARRLLTQLKMNDMYKGLEKVEAQMYNVEDDAQDRQPFRAVLDVGLKNCTTGAKVFACLKGAVDGGLSVPHSEKRFPGFSAGQADDAEAYDPKMHRERIFGAHVDKYMAEIKGDADKYKLQFRKWDENLKKAGSKSVEALMTKVFAEIRKNPVYVKKVPKKVAAEDRKFKIGAKRLTLAQRKKAVAKKIKTMFTKKK